MNGKMSFEDKIKQIEKDIKELGRLPEGEVKKVKKELQDKLNVGPMPRGGNVYTPGSSGSNLNQSSGGSFRMIVDTGNWDDAVGTNTPGQSGNPDSKFYSNLFKPWAMDEYFPVFCLFTPIKNPIS
jgi:acyl-homoserine lactone acylase PvdQ